MASQVLYQMGTPLQLRFAPEGHALTDGAFYGSHNYPLRVLAETSS
jgi:hypothetical protein